MFWTRVVNHVKDVHLHIFKHAQQLANDKLALYLILEKKMFGLQPKERFECAFDIIEPTKNPVNDAEVLLVTDQVMHSFASISESGCFFRISHVNLLKGILNHFGIAKEDHRLVHDTIRHSVGNESKKFKMATLSQFIPDQVVANLFNVL